MTRPDRWYRYQVGYAWHRLFHLRSIVRRGALRGWCERCQQWTD